MSPDCFSKEKILSSLPCPIRSQTHIPILFLQLIIRNQKPQKNLNHLIGPATFIFIQLYFKHIIITISPACIVVGTSIICLLLLLFVQAPSQWEYTFRSLLGRLINACQFQLVQSLNHLLFKGLHTPVTEYKQDYRRSGSLFPPDYPPAYNT